MVRGELFQECVVRVEKPAAHFTESQIFSTNRLQFFFGQLSAFPTSDPGQPTIPQILIQTKQHAISAAGRSE